MTNQRTIVCQNPACGTVKAVKSAYEQRRKKFCSRRCNGIMRGAKNLAKTDRRAAALKSAQVRRQSVAHRLAGLSPMQIYRRAFAVGWKAGVRYSRKWAA